MEFFATAAKGTEPALRDELRELWLPKVRCDRGGVQFEGTWEHAWKACLHSRVALRVLAVLGRFDAKGGDALYEAVRSIDWEPYLTPRHTLAVSAHCRSSELTHTNFIAQRTKDGIVDPLRDRLGERPSVDRKDPDVHIFMHLVKDVATVYLDLAGESLHRRGYRAEAMDAPLKENLAAAMLRLAGWNRQTPFLDPMCGSGTLAIEAALWAGNVAPGLLRKRMGFQRWALFDDSQSRAWQGIMQEARQAIRTDIPPIMAADVDPRAVERTRANARLAGVRIEAVRRSIRDTVPLDPPGLVALNPPYGHRIESEAELHREMSGALQGLEGHTIAILAGNRVIETVLKRRPDKWWLVFNGDLPCRLLLYCL
jgi:putative N6-adenine-specific DNA methylase